MKAARELNPEQRELVIQHISFARRLARQFARERQRGDLSYEDFEAAAMLGLCDAASRFDVQKGQHFQVFSVLRIRGAMIDLLRSIGSLPRMYFVKAETADDENQNEQPEPALPFAYTQTELAGIVNSNVTLNMHFHRAPIGEEPQLSYSHGKSPEEIVINADACNHIRELVRGLPDKERSVVQQHYFGGTIYGEMDEARTGYTKSWLSHLHHKGLRRLQKSVRANPQLKHSFEELCLS